MTDKTRINIWVSPEQKALWDESAGTLGISLTDLIKRAVHALLKPAATAATVDIAPLLEKLEALDRKLDVKLEQKAALDGIGLMLKNFDEDTVTGFLKHGDFSLASMAQMTTIGMPKLLEATKKLEAAGKIARTGDNKWTLK